MPNAPAEFTPDPDGLIEFDPVEPAALIQQAAQEAPPDDGLEQDALSPVFGQQKGSKTAAGDHLLAGTTIDWFVALPAAVRPKALCERYPHVANRLARGWDDLAHSARQLRTLARDVRWGTAGFPGLVQNELQRLLDHLNIATPTEPQPLG